MMHEKSSSSFKLSAFGDEISADLRDQLHVLRQLRIGYLELRDVWSKNVLHLDDAEVAKVGRICAEHEVAVSCIGSPVGKSPITQPIEHEISNLSRIFQIAAALGTRRVRIFSFYPPHPHTNVHYDQYVAAAISRLARLTEMARREGFFLLLENEKEIVSDTIERCHAIVSAIDSPHLRCLWDPANFVQVGEAEPTLRGWPPLGPYVSHVHVKDALLADGSVQAAGEGDGQVGELLARLRDNGYQGFLALEPHLAVAGRSGGFSGIEGMTRAVKALRWLMAAHGCIEEQRT